MKRIFWLGMHKILVQTELPRLRQLGYEVFNPPYLSEVEDQSAASEWDENQPTTLPAKVFTELSRLNFFYTGFAPVVADMLNRYFDCVIVTCAPQWLLPVLKNYFGPVIFRTFGQTYVMSEMLERLGVRPLVESRANFSFVPFHAASLGEEGTWLAGRAVTVPYCLTNDVLDFPQKWQGRQSQPEIALSCPNIDNDFYASHFRFIKRHFPHPFYRIYGVQLSKISDPQVVGTLDRMEQLRRFGQSRGYLYTYDSPRVCYLPPIEMMALGGPVLFLAGSLLDSYFPQGAPGRCHTPEEAVEKSLALHAYDATLINGMLKSQDSVLDLYHPAKAWPVFDRVFTQLIN